MRSVLSTVTALIAVAFAASAVRADVPAITVAPNGYNFRPANGTTFSIGYTFTLNHPITITALGIIDFGGTTVAAKGSMPVALYWSNPTSPNVGTTTDGFHQSGTPVPGASVDVLPTDPILSVDGSPYVSGDGFRYHILDTPITLYSDRQASTASPAGYEIQANNRGSGYATNWSGTATYTEVNAPIRSTWSSIVPSGADYQTNTLTGSEGFGQAFFGPNFLIQTPEPTAITLLALTSLTLLRRR